MTHAIRVLVIAALFAAPLHADDVVGLWAARRYFGPDLKGNLTIERTESGWRADIGGRNAAVKVARQEVTFEIPDGGAFRGKMEGDRIVGHWIQPSTASSGMTFASPVTLRKQADGRWLGVVAPLDDLMTYFLPIQRSADGTLTTFLRNPERNAGRFTNIERVAVEGSTIKLLGGGSVVAETPYDGEGFAVSLRGATMDFHRASASDEAIFYPRGKTPPQYTYRKPQIEDDGWPVADVEDVGISRPDITRFVQMLVDTRIDSVHTPDIHGVLIARHGKLVLEEYFHGFHREGLHDTRSAAKSVTSVLVGAAALHDVPIGPSTSVYQVMGGAGDDARRRAMTLENLLTMSSGLDCDDADPKSPGNEDTMQEQTAQPDWYRFTLDLKMIRSPGEKAVYCSCQPNLAGGVLAKAAGRWLADLFREYVADPMQIRRYALDLMPTGEPYMGGGARFLPRDFMKFGQVLLDGGRWRGHQIVSPAWAAKSTSPRYEMGTMRYGYLWWIVDFPYKDRQVRAFFAGGNGGQVVMGVPDLDLLIAFYGGNYSDPAMFTSQRVYVPQYILPAVK